MTRKGNWLNVLWWAALYIFWIMVFQKRAFSFSRTATIEFCYLIFIAANFYFNIYYTFPVLLYRKKYIFFFATMLTGIVATALLRVPLAMYLNQYHFLIGQPQPDFLKVFISSLLNIFIWVVCILAGKLMIDRFHFQQHIDEMSKQKEQAELDFLNAQFNPHFLFNSINSIYGHIDKHNTAARNMLLTFSEMLRYQLYDCNNNLIAIDKEINYIKNYVAMQQGRKEASLIVDLSIAENVKGFSIAPLLFIAFIENCFKYVGSGEETVNRVAILLAKKDDSLHFKCYNTKEINYVQNIEHRGIGISNAQRRLALLYPKRYHLDITDDKTFYEINLKIQIQ